MRTARTASAALDFLDALCQRICRVLRVLIHDGLDVSVHYSNCKIGGCGYHRELVVVIMSCDVFVQTYFDFDEMCWKMLKKYRVQLKMGQRRDLDLIQENERDEPRQKRIKVAVKDFNKKISNHYYKLSSQAAEAS